MKTWRIPVVWQEIGTVEVDAKTLAEAIDIAKTADLAIPDDGEYLADSWEVDCDDVERVREIYNWNQQDEKPEEYEKVVHAYWKPMKAYPREYVCSNCGELWNDIKTRYCHECGARMDEDAGDQKD